MPFDIGTNTITIAPHQHESLKAHLKAAFLKTGHASEEVAEALATVALSTIGTGAFQQ